MKKFKISFYSIRTCYHEAIIEADHEPTDNECWKIVDEAWKDDNQRDLGDGIKLVEVKWDIDCYTNDGPEFVEMEDD